MTDYLTSQLILHGTVCMLVGLLCGVPLGRAINNDHGDAAVHGWRVAHLGLALGGPLLYSIAAILPRISDHGGISSVATWSFVASVYGFVIALPPGAAIRERGLRSGKGLSQLVYVGNLIGAAGSLVGTLALLGLVLVSMLSGQQ